MIDDGDAAAEAPVGLGKFEADITAAKHDQMARQPVQFQRLDMGERFGFGETRNGRNAGVSAEVEEKLLGGEPPRPAVVQRHLDRPGRDEARMAHDEFGAGCLVALEMKGDEAFDHGALALHDLVHVDRNGAGDNAEFPGAGDDPDDARAPDLVLAGQAVDVRAGAADPAPFDHGHLAAGLRQVPGKVFAAFSAADDDCVVLFRSGHCHLHSRTCRRRD